MDWYELTKWLHIIGSTVLFGTGAGTAFQMVMAMRDGEPKVVAAVARRLGDRRLGVHHACGYSSARHRHYNGIPRRIFAYRAVAPAGLCALHNRFYRVGSRGVAPAPHSRSGRCLRRLRPAALQKMPALLPLLVYAGLASLYSLNGHFLADDQQAAILGAANG